MIFNTRYTNLPELPVDRVWAKLTRIDKPGEYIFLINPTAISYTVNNNISTLTSLGKNLPYIVPQNAGYQISLPLQLTTPGNNRDLSDDIKILREFSTMVGQRMPSLSFEFGDFRLPLCCIASLSIGIVQTRSGKPTSVVGGIVLVVYDSIKPPEIFDEATKVPGLSARDQTKIADRGRKYEKEYSEVRVEGDYLTGISRKTKKKVRLDKIKDVIGVYTVPQPQQYILTKSEQAALDAAKIDYTSAYTNIRASTDKDVDAVGRPGLRGVVGTNKVTGKVESLVIFESISNPPTQTP